MPCRRTAGFTLIELMISIAMVLMLVAGINAVFQAATKTTSTGLAVEEMTRSMRATEQQLNRDFTHVVPISEMPCLTIYSMQQFAFRNRADMNNDPDGRPQTIDLNSDGKEGNIPAESSYAYPFNYNERNHRIDRIGFFARNAITPFQSQTGEIFPLNSANGWPLVSPDKSTEAWVWYGHLRVPTMPAKPSAVEKAHGGRYYDPGEANAQDNVKNFFSDDWCFGRMAILLKDFAGKPGQSYLWRSNTLLRPLGKESSNSSAQVRRRWMIAESRLDMADATIRWFRDEYYNAVVDDLMNALDYRFNCKPWVTRTSDAEQQATEVALTVPFLQRGVTQFAIEFAGDFIKQNANGTTDNSVTGGDGEIDYVLIPDPIDYNNFNPNSAAQVARATKKIRWYGMPRNADRRNDFANGQPSIPTYPLKALTCEDVLPLADVAGLNNTDARTAIQRFEILTFWDPKTRQTIDASNGLNIPRPPNDYGTYTNPRPGMNLVYNCTWNADELDNSPVGVPSMIRIVMTLSDVDGRLPEGQTVEYVFKLTE